MRVVRGRVARGVSSSASRHCLTSPKPYVRVDTKVATGRLGARPLAQLTAHHPVTERSHMFSLCYDPLVLVNSQRPLLGGPQGSVPESYVAKTINGQIGFVLITMIHHFTTQIDPLRYRDSTRPNRNSKWPKQPFKLVYSKLDNLCSIPSWQSKRQRGLLYVPELESEVEQGKKPTGKQM